MQLKKFSEIAFSFERNTEVQALLILSTFSPPDLDTRVDSPAMSAKGS